MFDSAVIEVLLIPQLDSSGLFRRSCLALPLWVCSSNTNQQAVEANDTNTHRSETRRSFYTGTDLQSNKPTSAFPQVNTVHIPSLTTYCRGCRVKRFCIHFLKMTFFIGNKI